MREKYYIRTEDGMILGLRYDGAEIMIAGPWRFLRVALNISVDYFGAKDNNTMVGSNGRNHIRFRLLVSRPEWAWERGLPKLKREYLVEETRSIRRLCR